MSTRKRRGSSLWFQAFDMDTVGRRQVPVRFAIVGIRRNLGHLVIFGKCSWYRPNANVFQPDLALFSERRRRFLTDKGAEGAPDLVVEIPPKTAHLDFEQKRLVYARTGVDELWVVDPEGEEVRVYLFREDPDLPKVILRSGDLLKTSNHRPIRP